MENQHRKIKGYRELSQQEIDLMNKIKQHGVVLESLVSEIQTYLFNQCQQLHQAAYKSADEVLSHVALDSSDKVASSSIDLSNGDALAIEEYERFTSAEPQRWAAIAKTDFQTGLMALTRAIAQPGSF